MDLDESKVKVFAAILAERWRQDEKWGEQNHPMGTSSDDELFAAAARARTNVATKNGSLTWALILEEETWEALAEEDESKLREELIQVAAVATAWIECIDRNGQE